MRLPKGIESFDFDMVVFTFSQSLSPGNEQRNFWSSGAADTNGSRNIIGIKNNVIDLLIEDLINAKDREDLITISRALDRVLLWNYYVNSTRFFPCVLFCSVLKVNHFIKYSYCKTNYIHKFEAIRRFYN